MSLKGKRPQKTRQLELALEGRGESPENKGSEEEPTAVRGNERLGNKGLMEDVCERENLRLAMKRVRQNKGGPGIDGMTVEALPGYLKGAWPRIREELLTGKYQPARVKQEQIPKTNGGMRTLGIPTVVDRFIQQALLQVIQPIFDPGFSKHSHGFRPGKRAHDAVIEAQGYVQAGRQWVVDVDLEKFFDRVNHDVLMGRLAKRIDDRRVLGLIRRYLEVGSMAHGVAMERHEGTPQGGPLSPLLANVLLDEVDKALEKRGHAFVRYADDCNVYVRSRRTGERVMELLRKLYAGLRLKVNEAKSAVDWAYRRKILGYSFWVAKGKVVKRRVAGKSLATMKENVRRLTRRTCGQSMAEVCERLGNYLRGWKEYFRLADTPKSFADLDSWIRHRLRALQLAQWKTGKNIYRELRKRNVPGFTAMMVAKNRRRWWRNSEHLGNKVIPNRFFDRLGVTRLAK